MYRHASWGGAVLVVALAVASRSEAGHGNGKGKRAKVSADFSCGVVREDGVTPVPARGKARIGDDVTCGLRLSSEDPDDMSGYVARVQTSWTVRNGDEKLVRSGPMHIKEPIEAGDELAALLVPVAAEDAVDFVPCVDFTIEATVESGAHGVVWRKTLKVPQRCEVPKATLACTDDVEGPIECLLTGVPAYAASAWISSAFEGYDDDGNPTPKTSRTDATGSAAEGFAFTLDPEDDFVACDDATVEVHVTDARALPLFSKAITIRQDCPE